MASTTLSQLPLATSLSGAELLLGQQGGTTVAISVSQVIQLSGQFAAGPTGAVQYSTAGILTGTAAFSYTAASQTLAVPNLSVSTAITGGSFSGSTVTASGAITSTASVTASQTTAAFNYGALTYADTGNIANFENSQNNYVQITVQNPSTGAAASADIIVANSATTATTGYGDFGINSVAFSGTGSLGAAGYVYLYSQGVDLAIGTGTANAIHFVANGGSTDAMTISSAGVTTIANASITSGSISGAVSATTLSASGAVTLNGAGAAISLQPTGAGSVTISPAAAGSINNMTVGQTTAAAGTFTTLGATAAVSLNPLNANVSIQPTGTGSVTIAPAGSGTINNVTIGNVTPAAGTFSSLTANSNVFFQGSAASIYLSPTTGGTVTINPNGASTMDNVAIGNTTPLAGSFTRVNVTGATLPANGIYLSAASTLSFSTGSTLRGSINSTGGWVLPATTTGTANLAITCGTAAGTYGLTISAASTFGANGISIAGNGNVIGTSSFDLTQDSSNVANIIQRGSGSLAIQTTSSTSAITFYTNSLLRGFWVTTGGLSISAPTSGSALSVAGVAGSAAVSITPAAASAGLSVAAGSTTAVAAQISGGTGAPAIQAISNQGAGTAALRCDNTTVANSTGVGSLLLRNSTSAANTGWMAINLDGTTRYVPYWS